MQLIDFHTHARNTPNSIFNVIFGKDEVPENGWFSVGIHPWYVDLGQIENLVQLASHPNCVAMGECGLDRLCETPFDLQITIFKQQIEWAIQLRKPMIIHCVKAFDELLKIRKEFLTDLPWIVHGFNQNETILNQLSKHDFYFSFGKALLKPDSNASRVIGLLSQNRILLETDDSDLSIHSIYERAAHILALSETELVSILQQNFKTVFGEK